MWKFCKTPRAAPGFFVDQPPNDATYTAELFAQVRDNRRILDDFKIVLGGTDCLEANLGKIFNDPVIASHTISIQRWPRDLDLRKGLLSSLWKDIAMLVSARDASVLDELGAGIPASEFLKMTSRRRKVPRAPPRDGPSSLETTRSCAFSYRDSQQLLLF
jgi:hypothetical protein